MAITDKNSGDLKRKLAELEVAKDDEMVSWKRRVKDIENEKKNYEDEVSVIYSLIFRLHHSTVILYLILSIHYNKIIVMYSRKWFWRSVPDHMVPLIGVTPLEDMLVMIMQVAP